MQDHVTSMNTYRGIRMRGRGVLEHVDFAEGVLGRVCLASRNVIKSWKHGRINSSCIVEEITGDGLDVCCFGFVQDRFGIG